MKKDFYKGCRSEFTFHNVSINSNVCPSVAFVIKKFTFHNVSINSEDELEPYKHKWHLHSTMFLLIQMYLD